MELSINLEFSESLSEFRYQCITTENQGDYKTVARDLNYSDALRFTEDLKVTFPLPLLFVSVVCQFNAWKLKNKIL